MPPLVTKLVTSLRAREEPVPAVARKVVSNLYALACARLFLGGCDVVGPGARCFGRPHVENRGHISLGRGVAVGCAFGAMSLVAERGAEIVVGDDATINYGTSVRAQRAVHIGRRVLVGPHCVIEDGDGDGSGARIEIGDDVWLAARVVVRPGATIGQGAVITAGSVVEGTIPANAVASGSPARVLRIREVGHDERA